MKGLFLYGINCTCDIWSQLHEDFLCIEIEYVEYPHTITKCASCIADITKWVSDTYGSSHYDFVVGHSMGGIIALELAVKFGLSCHQIILKYKIFMQYMGIVDTKDMITENLEK